MVERSISTCRLMDRCKHALADLITGYRLPGLASFVAVAIIAVGPRPGFAEGATGQGPTPVEQGSTESAEAQQPAATPAERGAANASRPEDTTAYWLPELQRLMTSDERKELVAQLGTLMREGNTARAKQMISAAIDTGTLAFMMLAHIDDPALHAWLQEQASERRNAAEVAASRSSGDVAGDAAKAASTPGEDTLGRERDRANTLQSQLDAARAQLAALEAASTRASEIESALEQEKQRNASAMHDLETVHGQLADARESAARAAVFKDDAAREKGRADAASQDLARLNERLAALQGTAAEAAELKTMLAQEKERSDSAARDREALKEQLATLKESGARAAEIENAAAREKQRADTAVQQLSSLQEQFSEAKASEARAQGEIKQEKERSAMAAQQLESAQGEIAALKAKLDDMGDVGKALRQEKENSAAALRALEAVKGQLAREAVAQARDPKADAEPRKQVSEAAARPAKVRMQHPRRQQATVQTRRKVTSRLHRSRHYGQVRRGGVWTGLMGGYGNARGSRTTNGPGIW